MSRRSLTSLEKRQKLKEIKRMMEMLKQGTVLVEGKKDVQAFERIGIKARSVSGVKNLKVNGKIFLMMDMDRGGEKLMKKVGQEIEWMAEHDNGFVRKKLAGLLELSVFENIDRKYKKMKQELEE